MSGKEALKTANYRIKLGRSSNLLSEFGVSDGLGLN